MLRERRVREDEREKEKEMEEGRERQREGGGVREGNVTKCFHSAE